MPTEAIFTIGQLLVDIFFLLLITVDSGYDFKNKVSSLKKSFTDV